MNGPLVPLTVALPLITAALLAALGAHLPRLLPDVAGIGCAAAVAAIDLVLVLRSGHATIVYWFGGWRPVHGFAPGVGFVVDPLAAADAALAAVVVLASLVYSWNRFEDVRYTFYALMLAFLAGMNGFALSGDLFNLFVFFELMSVAGYALSGYRVERPDVLQGSMNFAVLNSIGAFTMLMGIALLYGSTGQLNLADLGSALARHHPPGLLVAALTLVTVGFLVKGGVAPFHFWLSDAYAVASAPVAAIFTAVMSDLAFHVYADVYHTVFAPAVGADSVVRRALLSLAVLSAVVGAVMCFLQADLKRQLAFLTVTNGGVVLAGIAALDPAGLAGATMFIIAAGLLRGALMLTVGRLIVQFGSSDELLLRGRGRRHLALGVLIAVCAAGLAALPGFGPFLSLSLVYDGLARAGDGWVAPLLAACLAVSAAAVLRAAARIFLGWGAAHDPALTRQAGRGQRGQEPSEDEGSGGDGRHREGHGQDAAKPGAGDESGAGDERGRRRWVLAVPAALAAAGYCLAFAPGLAGHALKAAAELQDHVGQARLVLQGIAPPAHPPPRYAVAGSAWAIGAASIGGALLAAAAGLWWPRWPARLRQPVRAALGPAVTAVKAVHSGAVGDYATWLIVGTAALALAWAAGLR